MPFDPRSSRTHAHAHAQDLLRARGKGPDTKEPSRLPDKASYLPAASNGPVATEGVQVVEGVAGAEGAEGAEGGSVPPIYVGRGSHATDVAMLKVSQPEQTN